MIVDYENVLGQAQKYYELALKNYSLKSYPEILPDQIILEKAVRLLHTVEKQGYNDYRWCGLLGKILWYLPCCSAASFMMTERACILSPDIPKELLEELDINSLSDE